MAEEDGRAGQRDWGGNTASLGGYGSAGLFSRRRQMERTQGGSYQNLSNVSRAQARGGYASMPGQGPAPLVTEPKISGHTGPSGPTKMAHGVAPDFTGRIPDTPNWGQTSRLLGRVGGAALAKGLLREKKMEREPDVPPFTSRWGGTYGKGPEEPKGPGELGSGPRYEAIKGGPKLGMLEAGDREVLQGEVVDEVPPYIRGQVGSGYIDVDSWELAGELDNPQSNPQSNRPTTRTSSRAKTMDALESGPRPAGELENKANSYEFGNAYYGQSPGRRATRGERRARKDIDQGQIFGLDWKAV